jgi:hypothetical protein
MATASVSKLRPLDDPIAKGVISKQDPNYFDNTLPRMWPVLRHIYIYSVARRDFQKKHCYFNGTLQGCKNNERYVLCYSLADPPQQLSADVERGGTRVEVEPRAEAGWRVAIDILNPNNPGMDPYLKLNPQQASLYSTGQNVDLIKYGLFPSLHNPPLEDEIQRAEQARDEQYMNLWNEALQEHETNPQGFRLWLRNHPDVSEAGRSLGMEAEWLTTPVSKMACPNCGDVIRSGIAFHKSTAGVLCIIDRKRAIEAGAIKEQPEVRERPIRG